jgi:hypothetical protein
MLRFILYALICYFIYQYFILPWAQNGPKKPATRRQPRQYNPQQPRSVNDEPLPYIKETPATEKQAGKSVTSEITFSKKAGDYIDFEEIK